MKALAYLSFTLALIFGATALAQQFPQSTNFTAVPKSTIGTVVSDLVKSSTNWMVNLPIPDNNPSGVSSTKEFSAPIDLIGEVRVTLNISGGFNGDLFGFLTHGRGFSVLLNRPGRTDSNPIGYSDSGMNATFADAAPNGDVHNYRVTLVGDPNLSLGGPLTGLWAPDARTADPNVVVQGDPRTAFLNSFYEVDPNGKWTLFLADVSPGGTSTLNSWGIEVVTIPEPSTWALFALGCCALLCFRSRRAA